MQHKDNLIWIDLEMTGLDTQNDYIIEIATIVTDAQLNVLAEGPVLAIHQSDEVLAEMDEWNTNQHGKSGLTQRVRDSRVSEAEAEVQTLEFLRKWVPERASPMCGNSICQDRRFLQPQGAGPALGTGCGQGVQEGRCAPGHGRHPRLHCRATLLPRTPDEVLSLARRLAPEKDVDSAFRPGPLVQGMRPYKAVLLQPLRP